MRIGHTLALIPNVRRAGPTILIRRYCARISLAVVVSLALRQGPGTGSARSASTHTRSAANTRARIVHILRLLLATNVMPVCAVSAPFALACLALHPSFGRAGMTLSSISVAEVMPTNVMALSLRQCVSTCASGSSSSVTALVLLRVDACPRVGASAAKVGGAHTAA